MHFHKYIKSKMDITELHNSRQEKLKLCNGIHTNAIISNFSESVSRRDTAALLSDGISPLK